MKIRKDFQGCVIAQGHHLFAGDDVPEGILVADWLLDGGQPAGQEEAVEDDSTEIVIDEEAEIGGDDAEQGKPTRSDNKQAWFAYASELGVIEENATIEDYSKADLIELVG